MGRKGDATVLKRIGEENFGTCDVCYSGVLVDYVGTAVRFEDTHAFKIRWV